MNKFPCDCPCHKYGDEFCELCYAQHGISYREWKNKFEPTKELDKLEGVW